LTPFDSALSTVIESTKVRDRRRFPNLRKHLKLRPMGDTTGSGNRREPQALACAMPDKSMILDHLELARRHVAEGEEHIVRQRAIVAGLERDGHDTFEAKASLAQFEELYRLHVADRDRLEKELAEASQ
jgi:hypothetical protein